MTVLGLIPARGGSKRIPRKALRLLGGKPLLQYTVEGAREASLLSRIVLTTDDEEIAALGRRLGVDVPFLRPVALALDTTPMIATVRHALNALEQYGETFDAVCLLQPTAPFRSGELIDRCITLLEASAADAVVTMMPIPAEFHPDWAYRLAPDGTMELWNGAPAPAPRGQDLSPAFCRTGDVYVTRRDAVLQGGTLYGSRTIACTIAPSETINLDTPEDWDRAVALLARRALDTAGSTC